MDDGVLTKSELAERWKVSERTIDRWVTDGKLKPCDKLPALRFPIDYVRAMEGMSPEAVTSMKLKKLQRELNREKQENDRLRQVIKGVAQVVTPEMTVGEFVR